MALVLLSQPRSPPTNHGAASRSTGQLRNQTPSRPRRLAHCRFTMRSGAFSAFRAMACCGLRKRSRRRPSRLRRPNLTRPPQEQPKSPVASAVAETAVDDGYAGANVVTLRPMCAAQRESADAAEALSPQEQSAFDEIARTLGYPTPTPAWPPPPGSARDLIDHVGRVLETSRAPASLETPKPDREAGLIDLLPVGVLVARGSHTLFANRTLLDYLGYADLEALMADGGLARVFLGRSPQSLADSDSYRGRRGPGSGR